MNAPHLKQEAKSNLQKAKALSDRLHMPPGELLHVITLAGLEAIEATLENRGKVTFPLAFETAGNIVPPLDARTVTELPALPGMGKTFLIAPAPPETLPVYLPATITKLHEIQNS